MSRRRPNGPMVKSLNVLIVEDVERDAVLLLRELRRGGYDPAFERVETAEGMTAALEKQPWDIIISDYMMPHFSALKALALMLEKRPELPFIIVSGTVSEEIAADAMRAGAHDFMRKGKLARLLPAIERELHEAAGRIERKKMKAQLLIAVRLASIADARERTVGDREEQARLGQAAADTREAAADTREAAADTRDAAADTREAAANSRGLAADTRGAAADTRDAAADTREAAANTRGRFLSEERVAADTREVAANTREAAADTRGAAADTREAVADTREAVADTREAAADSRRMAADTREATADTRGAAADTREAAADTREATADTRERTVGDREELARLREEALLARDAADEANAERDRLLVQTRAANEKLVLATIEAQKLADDAELARAKIAESEERFRSLVTTSAAIVWQADALGRQIDSPSWTAFTGLSLADEAEAIQVIHADDRERVRDAWTQATASRSPYVAEFRLQRRDGSYAWVLSRAVPIPELPAPIREWIGMTTDISDSKRIEEAREQFIGILAHDLRNPLGAIEGTAELLGLADDIPERHARNFARIARNTQRMAAMIRDVLDFTRGRLGGGIPIEREPCDLGHICAEAVAEMKQAHPGRAIHCDAIGNLSGKWDPARIEQVLSNLIGNAVQHGLDPIRVSARNDDRDGVIVTVHSMGTPIPDELIPTIFEPFRRGERGSSQGLGLGLYIVSEIVRSHGASVSVSSSERDGTMFTIHWPVATY
jgi:PAS domain S-box-containing protein